MTRTEEITAAKQALAYREASLRAFSRHEECGFPYGVAMAVVFAVLPAPVTTWRTIVLESAESMQF